MALTGTAEPTVVELPSCPSTFRPQQRTDPPTSRAQLWKLPSRIDVAVEIPNTVTGEDELANAPWPSCPSSPLPQHCTSPEERSAQEWLRPAETRIAVEMPATGQGSASGSPPKERWNVGD